MAGPGTFHQTLGFGDTFGGKFAQFPDYTGVASYVNGVGELVDPKAFGFPNTILWMDGSVSQDGTHFVRCQPTNSGYTQWHIRWFLISTGLEVANTLSLTTQTVRLFAIGT